MLLISMLLCLGDAQAENETRPLRPTTHPADPNLSEGSIENFRKLYLDKEAILKLLEPASGKRTNTDNDAKGPKEGAQESDKEGYSTLPIVNRTIGWVDIEINDKKIGRLGPLTTGLIHYVDAGSYDVTFHVENVQYSYTERVETISLSKTITPGNMTAQVAAAPDYKKPGFDDLAPVQGGNLKIYRLATPYMLHIEEPSEEDAEGTLETAE